MLSKQYHKIRRHRRLRARLSGTSTRPRLSVFRSHKHLHLQLIDDEAGKTLAAASTLKMDKIKGRQGKAEAMVKTFVQQAQKLGVKAVVFDRGGNRYHGRVKNVAELIREAGIKI